MEPFRPNWNISAYSDREEPKNLRKSRSIVRFKGAENSFPQPQNIGLNYPTPIFVQIPPQWVPFQPGPFGAYNSGHWVSANNFSWAPVFHEGFNGGQPNWTDAARNSNVLGPQIASGNLQGGRYDQVYAQYKSRNFYLAGSSQLHGNIPAQPKAEFGRERPSLPGIPIASPTALVTEKNEYHIRGPLGPQADLRAGGGVNVGMYYVQNVRTRQIYVEKRLRMTDTFGRDRAYAESAALLQLRDAGNSDHINQIIERFYNGTSSYSSLILEHCDSGTLDDFIDRHYEENMFVPENFIWHVIAGMASALSLCHYGITDPAHPVPTYGWDALCHLDVKPSNVFLTSVGQQGPHPRVVLGDFGCVVKHKDIMSGNVNGVIRGGGTPGWMPPEVGEHGQGHGVRAYGPPTDIWQTGGVIQCLCKLLSLPTDQVQRREPCGNFYSPILNKVTFCCLWMGYNDRPNAVNLYQGAKTEMARRGMKP